MEPTIIEQGEMILVGMADAGQDFHGLWMRFMSREGQIPQAIAGVAYEVHTHIPAASPTQLQECFVGLQVSGVGDIPTGMVVKCLPPARYAVFTHRLANGGYTGANADMAAWLRSGPYQHSGDYSVQRFDERFKGGDQSDSEIDFLIPIAEKG